MLTTETLNRIAKLTDNNCHGEALHVAAVAIDELELARDFAAINIRHEQLGHLPVKLYEERHSLYEKLMRCAKQKLSPTDYNRLHGAF